MTEMDGSSAAAALSRPIPRGATFAITVLTGMNLLNYIDRFVPSAVKELFKGELHLTDAETSYPLTAFVVVYMLASPVFGALSDRMSRKALIAGGVLLWSLATAAAAFATGFWTLLLARALVGVGEAAYATIAPSLIGDFYPKEKRNRILTIYYVAIPVGAALGFTLGGVLGQAYGWRAAFLICGLPGALVAALALLIRDPGRGTFDEGPPPPSIGWRDALRAMWKSRIYVNTVAGYTAVTFAAGAMADWFPAFLHRHRGLSIDEAGGLVGTCTVVGGLGGTVLGGLLADRLKNHTRQPYLAVSAISMIPATIFATLALVLEGRFAFTACIFLAQFFLWFYNGPVNALIVNAFDSHLVARAFSISILSIHLFGDAVSPPIVGIVSDATGNLPLAVMIIPVALAVGCMIWLWGWRAIPEPATAAP